MSRETYGIVWWLVHGGIFGLAVLFSAVYSKFQKQLSPLGFGTLSVMTLVFLKAVVLPFLVSFVVKNVPIRDEGMAIVIFHFMVIAPIAGIGLLMCVFQPTIRWIGIRLSLGFIAASAIGASLI